MSCGTRADALSPAPAVLPKASGGGIESHSGAHLPFQGLVRGLVVYVQTLNDAKEDASWPLGKLPAWNGDFISRLQRYYSDMSDGTLELALDVHPDLMVTRNTEDGYLYWALDYGYAIKEILDSLDTELDFSAYDRWYSEGSAYKIREEPDGKVDLLIFVFRSISNSYFLPFSGVSDLGFSGHHFLDGSLKRYVYGGSGQHNDAGSSGLTISYLPGRSAVMNPDFAFASTIHELGHKFFGEGHTNELYGGVGTMANAGNGFAMSAFERQLAGYLQFRDVHPGRDTVLTLRDYVTTGDAALLPIPQLDRAYYAFEFRGKKSEWDTAPIEGLYISRIYDSWSKSQKRVKVISAEGSFHWALDSASGKIHPVRPALLDGFSRLQRITLGGRNYWAEGWWGVPEIAFRDDRREMAVLKNPSSNFLWGPDTINTDLRVRLLDLTDSSATIAITYGAPVILTAEAPPIAESRLGVPYPHPIVPGTGATRIPVSIARAGRVRALLVDALGRTVSTVADANLAPGVHHLPFSAAGLTAGTYLLVLETPSSRSSRLLLITQ